MGVCLDKECSLYKEKIKEGLNIEVNEKNNIDMKYNQEEENQNNLEESELTKKDKQNINNQNMTNQNNNNINNSKTTNGYILYKLQSKFKCKVIRCSNHGHLSSNSVNIYNDNNNINKEKFDKLIYFTNLNDKNNSNNNSVIINTKTK